MAEKTWDSVKNLLAVIKDMGQSFGALAGFFSLFNDARPVVEGVLRQVSPEFALKLRRSEQQGSKGAADEVMFLKTLLIMDGDDPDQQDRPELEAIVSYLSWVNTRDLIYGVVFIWVTGLEMDDDERLRFLKQIALMTDDNGNRLTDEAHQKRFEFTQTMEIFRKPLGMIEGFLQKHPGIQEKIEQFQQWDATFAASAAANQTNFLARMTEIQGRIADPTTVPNLPQVNRAGWKYWFKFW